MLPGRAKGGWIVLLDDRALGRAAIRGYTTGTVLAQSGPDSAGTVPAGSPAPPLGGAVERRAVDGRASAALTPPVRNRNPVPTNRARVTAVAGPTGRRGR